MIKKQYKPSYYNFFKEYDNGRLVIYNTKTGAVDVVEKTDSAKVKEILNNKTILNFENNDLCIQMSKQGYIVNVNESEVQEIIDWNKSANNMEHVGYITILPTETCNFACPYCFIYTFRDKHMTEETLNSCLKYCVNFFEKNKNRKEGSYLEISWFGGEPLIAGNKIVEFMTEIRKINKSYPHTTVESGIVTNGYLLNYNLFKELINVGVNRIQITLDGDAENHDKLRTLKSGAPTFDVIYGNLLEIASQTHHDEDFVITLRGNFLRSSIENCRKLLSMFKRDFAHDSRFRIYFRPVYNFETDRNDIDSIDSDICGIEEGIKLQNELAFSSLDGTQNTLEKISNPLPQPTYSWCTSIYKNSHIIGYDGSVFSCDTMIVDKEKAIGKINNKGEIILNENANFWKKSIFEDHEIFGEIVKKCLECRFLPICMGGCNRARLVSGMNPCYWTEEIIYDAMKEYSEI